MCSQPSLQLHIFGWNYSLTMFSKKIPIPCTNFVYQILSKHTTYTKLAFTLHSLDPPFPPPLPPPFFLKGGIWKIKKGGGSMVQGQVFLKGGGSWHFSYLIFLRFIIFTFRNYFALCKIVLCIWRKIIFSATIILWKRSF